METNRISCVEIQSDLLRWLSERHRRLQQRDSWVLLPWTNCQRRTPRRLQRIDKTSLPLKRNGNNLTIKSVTEINYNYCESRCNQQRNKTRCQREWENQPVPQLRRRLECSSKRFKPAKSKNEKIQLNSMEWETRSNTFFLNTLHYRWECICTLTVWKGEIRSNIWRPEDFCCSGMVGLAGRPSTLV